MKKMKENLLQRAVRSVVETVQAGRDPLEARSLSHFLHETDKRARVVIRPQVTLIKNYREVDNKHAVGFAPTTVREYYEVGKMFSLVFDSESSTKRSVRFVDEIDSVYPSVRIDPKLYQANEKLKKRTEEVQAQLKKEGRRRVKVLPLYEEQGNGHISGHLGGKIKALVTRPVLLFGTPEKRCIIVLL